eukprot:TRINITY_DN23339_c0_g1_i1.p1 TRINITY_DN23339_c0_g1~~TRINITY_DN23339_c0_g1_i1.p1  ORF type:complete len:395 (+),score=19.31 TRINITY_DN23339_c0_g1_i1:119-1186(+)
MAAATSASLAVPATGLRAEPLRSSQRAAAFVNATRPAKVAKSAGVRCDASPAEDGPFVLTRRQTLLTAGAAASSPLWLPLVSSPPDALAADLIQRNQRAVYLKAVKEILFNTVNTNRELVPALLRLALNDIATYDKATKTGGANGSIRFSEELSRPENAGLKGALALLEGAKKEIDAGPGEKGGPLSYADLIQFGAQAAVKTTFLDSATRKCGGDPEKGFKLYIAIGSPGQWGLFEKRLGRADATAADPSGRVPNWEALSAAELKSALGKLGVRAYRVPTLAVFLGSDAEAVLSKLETDDELRGPVEKYRKSIKTVSENQYEVDLIDTFLKLSELGASISTEAYTYVPPRAVFKL